MARCFKTWTVLPHDPIRKLAENLWCVKGRLPNSGSDRRMTIARMRDGSLVVHNAIALEEPAMRELESFGAPRVLVVPGAHHRQDARIWKQRYPEMKVVCPAGARRAVEEVVPADLDYESAPADETVRLFPLEGCKRREGCLEVRSEDGVTLVVNDMVCNVPALSGAMGFLLAPTGQPAVPRVARWLLVSDRAALRSGLERLAATPGLKRLVPAHGALVEDDPAAALRTAASTL